MKIAINSSPAEVAGVRMECALDGITTVSTRISPAAWVTGICGPPKGHPLPRVTSIRIPSIVASEAGKAQSVDVLVRKIGQVAEPGLRIVQSQRIQGGDLHSSNSRALHLLKLSLDLRFGDCGTEPPPAHHDAAVVGRMRERLFELSQTRVLLGKARRNLKEK